ncbi:MAG: AAA family ATPase [bacterium]
MKKVDISGFKSFIGKSHLDFEPGVSAIVGPNGCGKTNVVDAIRWSLGEQSTRSLRCQNMLDIIFNGSQKRPALGMAEVTLVFDNSLHTIPLDFDEISITRKLFRSGESEYFINHVQCRLKDIRDLFLDTGIGYEGYSIMEQGKVEFILNAKPEERRELFEEAAGVSKYKARRDESLRKLEKVQFDLTRIQDTVNIVNDQIRQLDLAVKKAKQYKNGLEEFKKIEISDFLCQKGELQKTIFSAKEKIDSIENNLHASRALLDANEARTEELRVLLSEKEKIHSEYQARVFKIDSAISLSENRADNARKQSEEIKSRKEVLSQEVNDTSIKLKNMLSDYKNIITELAGLSEKYRSLADDLTHNEKLQEHEQISRTGKLQELAQLKERYAEIEAAKAKHVDVSIQHASNKSRMLGEQFSVEKEYAKRAERDAELALAHESLQQKINEIEIVFAQSHTELDAYISELRQRDEEIGSYQDIDDAINQKQLKICARISALSEMIESDPCHAGANALLSREWKGIYGPLHRLITFPDEYRYLILDGLGDYLNYFVSETIEEAEEAIQFLKRGQSGRARLFVLETLPHDVALPIEVMSAEKPLLSFIQYDNRIENLLRFLLQTTYVKGSTVYCDHIMYGGAEYSSDAYTVAAGSFQERDQLELELSKLQKERVQNKICLTDAANTLPAVKKAIAESDQILRTHEMSRNLLKTDLQKTAEEQLKVLSDMGSLYAQLHEFTQLKITLNKEIEHSKANQEAFDQEIELVKKGVLTIEAGLAVHNENLARIIKETNDKRITCSQLNERIKFKQQELVRIKATHEEYVFSQLAYQDELSSSNQKIKDHHNIIERERMLMDELFKEKEVQDTLLKGILDEKEECLAELHKVTEQVHALRSRVNAIMTDKQKNEIEYQKLMLQDKNINNLLHDKYSVSIDQAMQEYQPEPMDQEKAAKLKNRIESFGAVNLAAPEEYNQLEARYNFLNAQHEDIIKAKDDLHRVISKINATTKESFHKTFYQVRDNFKHIYQTLFQGGEADIRLTDEENLLETGVEIFAQPPGKKLQNISLLSGGERALTASALLFAFFMVKPSPVCILDEVDAPLDEANVGRFIRMIKDFARETQFLIITHNKRTMEICDTLYGVTMEEYGVSKLISIKLTKNIEENTSIKSQSEPAVV